MDKIKFNHIAHVGLLEKSGALVTPLAAASTTTPVVDKKNKPTKVKLIPPYKTNKKDIEFASWGVNNSEPNEMIADIDKVPASTQALNTRVEAIYGFGPYFYTEEQNEDHSITIKEILYKNNKDLRAFTKKIRINRFSLEMLNDLEGLGNVFPEFIVSNDYDEIISIRHQEAKYCRWSVMKNGLIEYCGISSEWGTNTPVTEDNCTVVMVADPWMSVDELKEWLKKGKIKKFIWPTSYPSLGKVYYQKPTWNSSRMAGWTQIAQLIPKAILNALKNAKRLQWHIKIPYEYWDKEYPVSNYVENPDQRKVDMESKMKEVDDFLAGSDNAGKSFYSHYGLDPVTRKEYPGWEFIPLDNNPKFDKEIFATATANAEILFSWGVDPALLGQQSPSGGQSNGAGSGSDKREADLILKGNKSKADIITEPIELAIEFNGWGKEDPIKMGFKKIVLTTLDKNPTGETNQEI
jgi:hypothetical protein